MTFTPAPFPVASGAQLLGEVISWTCTGVTVTHAALVAALKEAGLDENVARELAPRHAFTRACRKLSDHRLQRDRLRGEFVPPFHRRFATALVELLRPSPHDSWIFANRTPFYFLAIARTPSDPAFSAIRTDGNGSVRLPNPP